MYLLFFFKENSRYVDLKEFFNFFSYSPFISTKVGEDAVTFTYYNPSIELTFDIKMTKHSQVPDIYRLSPKYLDLDILAEISPLLSGFRLSTCLDFIYEMCQRFNFYIYNEKFKNVFPFSKDIIIESFNQYKDEYREQNQVQFMNLNYLNRDKLNNILKYLYEREELIAYYKEQNVLFPDIEFMRSKSNGKIYTSIMYEFDSLFAFPTNVDIVLYKDNNYVKALYLDELLSILERYLQELPGYGNNLQILDKNGVKKIRKLVARTKMSDVIDTFEKVEKRTVVDYK